MDAEARDRGRSASDVVVYLFAVAAMAAALTVIWLGMRAVMDIGGACAEGGPFVIDDPCPEGVPLLMTLAIPSLFLFGGLMVWRGSRLGGPYASLVALAWPALFLSLGWNFLEYAFRPPDGSGQIVWGWLIPGVLFVLMGGLPLVGAISVIRSGETAAPIPSGSRLIGTARKQRPTNRAAVLAASREAVRDRLVGLRDERASGPAADGPGLVDELERLAKLRASGALSYAEFEQAKKALLRERSG
jgi:hypothetical protein